MAVALGEPVVALPAMASAGQAADLKRHQRLRGKADHLAQEIGAGAPPQKRPQVHHIVAHRRSASLECRNPNLSEDHKWPTASYTTTRDTTKAGPVKDAFVGAELIDASDFTRREDALLGCGETGRMIADLTRAIELSPGDAHSFFSRAREKTEQKGNVKALADLDRSLARAQGG